MYHSTLQVLSFSVVTLIVSAAAALPPEINIQGTLEDSAGGPVTGVRDYHVRFFESGTGGSSIGEVSGTVTLSDAGRFSIDLVPPTAGLDASETWYELVIDAAADGINPDDVFPDRVQILSVPFALRSSDAQTLGGMDAADYATESALSSGLAEKASRGR